MSPSGAGVSELDRAPSQRRQLQKRSPALFVQHTVLLAGICRCEYSSDDLEFHASPRHAGKDASELPLPTMGLGGVVPGGLLPRANHPARGCAMDSGVERRI